MAFFIVIGIISLTVGVLFLFSPGTLRSINEAGMRVITTIDNAIFNYRIGLGLSLIIASFLFFFVAYYISVRG